MNKADDLKQKESSMLRALLAGLCALLSLQGAAKASEGDADFVRVLRSIPALSAEMSAELESVIKAKDAARLYDLLLEASRTHKEAREYVISVTFGRCGRPCVVSGNDGGYTVLFEIAAEAMLHEPGGFFVVDGACRSSCVRTADLAQEVTCITPRATFYFHKSSVPILAKVRGRLVSKKVRLADPSHSQPIDKWVRAHGDYPVQGWTVMPFKEARAFWPECRIRNVPLPRPHPRRAKSAAVFYVLSGSQNPEH